MKNYIVRIGNKNVINKLRGNFEKVGTPRALFKTIIVSTTKPKTEIENISGVISVEEETSMDFGEVQTQTVDNWALPRVCGSYYTPSAFTQPGNYLYERTGENVDIYIIDTGVRLSHNEFKDDDGNSRAIHLYPDAYEAVRPGDFYADYHGTSVASCAAGNLYGVAKEANIISVWCLKSNISFVKALDSVLHHHLHKTNNNPSIANMSLGLQAPDWSNTWYEETKELVNAGIICVACAQNFDRDLSAVPARYSHVVSCGATTPYNKMASWSNYGSTVDCLAPGELVKAAGVSSDNDYRYVSGTSFSTPIVSGVLALIVQGSLIRNENGVAEAIEILNRHTIKDMIDVKPNTPNKFIYSLVDNPPILQPIIVSGRNLLESIMVSTNIRISDLLINVISARLQQMIDNNVYSKLSAAVVISAFSTEINKISEITHLSTLVDINKSLIENSFYFEDIDFPSYQEIAG